MPSPACRDNDATHVEFVSNVTVPSPILACCWQEEEAYRLIVDTARSVTIRFRGSINPNTPQHLTTAAQAESMTSSMVEAKGPEARVPSLLRDILKANQEYAEGFNRPMSLGVKRKVRCCCSSSSSRCLCKQLS